MKLHIDFSTRRGSVKPMHAVNNAPVYKFASDQRITNLYDYQTAGIPYARNHDASHFSSYGGSHAVDVPNIFTDFAADPYSPESYDFACTDELMRVSEFAGVKTFYRLGASIEHYVKKFNTLPPPDLHKWAVICEHIIRHYTEGWADGFHYDIEYWEIWNEPDLDPDDSPNKRCWGGTKAEYFELYRVAATHLKKCFPHLKIGGPALAHDSKWAEESLSQLDAPLDFFSWHVYGRDIAHITDRVALYRAMLDRYGFTETESILNEWNYVRGWEDSDFLYSIRTISGLKGAAFALSAMLACQNLPLDMLMYYDARPSGFNGLWAPYTYDRLKGYYAFAMFNELYKLGKNVAVEAPEGDVYAAAARSESANEAAIVLSRYADECDGDAVALTLDLAGLPDGCTAAIHSLDESHDCELIVEVSLGRELQLELKPYESLLVKIGTKN